MREYFPTYFIVLFFTFNKIVQEAVIAEMAQNMKTYYSWDGQSVGFLMLAFTPISTPISLNLPFSFYIMLPARASA